MRRPASTGMSREHWPESFAWLSERLARLVTHPAKLSPPSKIGFKGQFVTMRRTCPPEEILPPKSLVVDSVEFFRAETT